MIHVCGKETPDDSKFCIECGKKIEQEYTGVTTRLQKDIEYGGRLEYGYFVASGNPYLGFTERYYYPSGRRALSLLAGDRVLELLEQRLKECTQGTMEYYETIQKIIEIKDAQRRI